MRTFLASFGVACLLACPAQAQTALQFLYVQGTIKTQQKPLEAGKFYDENTSVILAGKVAILYDTVSQKLYGVHFDRTGELGKVKVPVQTTGFKCCVSSFTSFLAHNKKPYPVLYPNIVFNITEIDRLKFRHPMALAYRFWDSKEDKFRMRTAPIKDNVLDLGQIVTYLMSLENKPILEPFFFYAYDKGNPDKSTLIAERALQVVDTEELQIAIIPFVQILCKKYPSPNKEQKEQIFSLLSDFVSVLYGYPDEFHFKKWLREYCNWEF